MRKWGVWSVRQPAEGSTWAWAPVARTSIAARAGVPARRSRPRAAADDGTLDAMRTGAQASIGPFDPPTCPVDWQTVTLAPCGATPAVTVCAYCGRGNDAGAQFCMGCGKPLSKSRAVRATAVVGPTRALEVGDAAIVLVLLDDAGTPVERFERCGPTVTIGRHNGDVRFPDDPFLSPVHAKLSWEQDRLMVRDLG